GDEAVVETRTFSLEGRPIRKVRQSVTRLEKQGYAAELRRVSALSDEELDGLEAVSRRWRRGAAERGFAMSSTSYAGTTTATAWSCWAAAPTAVSAASSTSRRATGAPRCRC